MDTLGIDGVYKKASERAPCLDEIQALGVNRWPADDLPIGHDASIPGRWIGCFGGATLTFCDIGKSTHHPRVFRMFSWEV